MYAASVLLSLTLTAPGAAQPLRVLPKNEAGQLLRSYLLRECRKCFERRRRVVSAITKPEQVTARRDKLRRIWLRLVGPFPERTPLKPRVVGRIRRPRFTVEKVIYESRPGHHVTANLYVPQTGKAPFPGVLIPCGHSRNGKAAEPYQRMAISLALHGFVALCYDPIGQGERFQTLDSRGKPIVGGTTEHTLIDIGARLLGISTATYRIWDGIRSLDYLAGRPEVDPSRLGCTGNSGGGTMTSYLMVTDQRIYAAAPSCYITSLERLFETIGPQDGEQNITGQVALGIEHADYLTMRAPKPTLVLTATRDFFDIDGSWRSFREAKRLYSILGFGERIDLFEYPDTHGFSKPRRTAALRWMRRWLQHIDDAATEEEVPAFTDRELQVTRCGQVLYELKGRSVWDLNLERAKELGQRRNAFWRNNSKEKCLARVASLAAVRLPVKKPEVRKAGVIERPEVLIEKLLIERPGEVPLPALKFVPRKAGQTRLPAILWLDGSGKEALAGPGGRLEKQAASGAVVLAVDLRGFGETAPSRPKRYWHNEYPIAYLAIHLARPLLGQRVEDAIAALEALLADSRVDPDRISLVGRGAAGPVALHAAALEKRFSTLTLEESIESYLEVVATPLSRGQLSNVVPGALLYYDLPDLIRAVSPRLVFVKNPVDPTGKPKKR